MRAIMAVIVALSVVAIMAGGTLAVFNDVESASGNTFAAATADFDLTVTSVTWRGHPSTGRDFTVFTTFGGAGVEDVERARLGTSDDDRYVTEGDWDGGYDSERVDLKFPDIPAGATVTGARVRLEWQRDTTITGARARFSGDNGTTFSAIQPLAYPPADTDVTATLDIFGLGLDTPGEINNLVVRFEAEGAGRTRHDLAEVEVDYNVVPGAPLVQITGLRPGEPQAVAFNVSNASSLNGTVSLRFDNVGGANSVDPKSPPEVADEGLAGPYVPEVVAADRIDQPYYYTRVGIRYNGVDVTPAVPPDHNSYVDISNLMAFTDLGTLAAGAVNVPVALNFTLDPPSQTGNVYRHDRTTLDIVLRMVQE